MTIQSWQLCTHPQVLIFNILFQTCWLSFVLWKVIIKEHVVAGKETLIVCKISGSLPDFPSLHPWVNLERSYFALFLLSVGSLVINVRWWLSLISDWHWTVFGKWKKLSYSTKIYILYITGLGQKPLNNAKFKLIFFVGYIFFLCLFNCSDM